MAEASKGVHEAGLTPETLDRHRAISSLMEELEAVDWYDQRIEASADSELIEILAHNRDEEKEHAAMVLEWLRRRDPVWDEYLKTYLFREGPIHEAEAEGKASEGEKAAGHGGGSLGIGSLKGKTLP
jgi:ferritin-like protein